MKKQVSGIVALLVAATVVSCQKLQLWSEQAEYNREHEDHCLKEYNSHVESLNSGVVRLHEALTKTGGQSGSGHTIAMPAMIPCYPHLSNSVAMNSGR